MSIHTTIKDEIKKAMLAKEAVRLTVLRGLLAAFTNELVSKGRKPQEELTDEEALVVIKRSINQHKDSIKQFKAGNREDLASSEQEELVILEKYMPAQMSQDEILPLAEAKKASMGITDKSKLGMLVGALMKDLKGKADGADVKAVVEKLFS